MKRFIWIGDICFDPEDLLFVSESQNKGPNWVHLKFKTAESSSHMQLVEIPMKDFMEELQLQLAAIGVSLDLSVTESAPHVFRIREEERLP
jgi:hypothetical protein